MNDLTSDRVEFPPIYTEVGDVYYIPFHEEGRVGYIVRSTDGSREEFLYFNPSDHEHENDANVFVYQGLEGDPAVDGPQHFYNVGRWEEYA